MKINEEPEVTFKLRLILRIKLEARIKLEKNSSKNYFYNSVEITFIEEFKEEERERAKGEEDM